MDWDISLKVAQILAPFLTSIMVTVLGVVIVRRIEGIKAEATKRSAFEARWADEFFDACQQFERALERQMVILVLLTQRINSNDEDCLKMQREQSEIHARAFELKFRIRRCAAFAQQGQVRISELADDSFLIINDIVAGKPGNLDVVFKKLAEFNDCARAVHAEILALGRAEHQKGPTK
jgi:hypothetical protein